MQLSHDAYPWRPWSPRETAERLARVAAPWGVTAGWALELFVGEPWREHDDLEIAVAGTRFAEVRAALGELELWVPAGGGALLPFGEMRTASLQTWGLERAAEAWRLDVFREPSEGADWICRRDDSIRVTWTDLLEQTPDGIPFVRPDVVLLFKAKSVRPKDQEDFDVVAPRLGPGRRAWLRAALERVHPGHAWLGRLGG